MIRIFKLVLLLVVSQVAFGQAPSNYTNINGRYRWIAGMFDSTFHIPKGTSPSLRTGGSTNAGGLFYNTSDSSVYTYTGTQWIKVRGSINPSDTTNKYVTQVYKKNGSDSVFYVKGGIHTWAFNDSTGSAGGGGGGKVYYFNGGVNMGTFGGLTMYELGDTANTGAAANFTRATTGAIANFITDPNKPGLLQIPAGSWTIDAWMSETGSGANHAQVWAVLEKWNGSTITTIATSPIEEITEGNSPNLYTWAISVPTTSLLVTDRIIIQFYITNTNGKTVTLYTQNGYVGEVHTTFTTGIGAINGLTAPAQYLVTGTSGTDFNISSVTATHTFNLPTASATNRGALSSADWTTFNSKLSPADTVSLSNRINLKLNISDTAAMLSPYARTNAVNAGLATKVNISDTATMLSPYARKNFLNAGTGISYSSTTGTIANTAPDQTVALNAGTGISISGTYPNFTITNSSPSSGGTVTSVGSNTGTGLTGGPITTSGTLAIDTITISTRAWRQKGIDSVQSNLTSGLALKVNISDTASMLSPYLRSNVAAATYVPQTRTITINGTSQDLSANRTFSVGTVTSVGITAGTGISVANSPVTGSGNITVTNTAPDQTVALTAGTGITIGGTYPSFTITNSSPSSGGTVTSVATNNGTGITGGTITGAGTLAIDTVVISTRAWRQKGIDSVQGNLTAGLALKLNISDTANMLNPYLRKVDTASLSNRINTKLNISDTLTMLGNYVNNVGYGLSKVSQVVSADSATLASYFLRRKDSLTATNLLGYVTGKILADTAAAVRAAAGGGSIGGSGTTNYLPKFTASTTLGDSRFFDNGTVTFLGNGDVNATPSTGIFSGTGGTGTNIAGAELRIRGGASTGNAAGGIISFYTSAAGSAGTGVNAATEIARFTTAGRLGIGTTSPANQLTVAGAGGAAYVRVEATDATLTAKLQARTATSAIELGAVSNSPVLFVTNDTERMRITSGGDLGIGTTTIGSKLQVNGNAAIGYSASTAAPTNGLAVSGQVIIGSTTPTGTLGVTGASGTGFLTAVRLDNSTNSAYQTFSFGGTVAGGVSSLVNANIFEAVPFSTGNFVISAFSNNMVFMTNNRNERMRITSGGSIGIGTTTIGSTLQVNGNAAIGYSASTAAPTNGLAVSGLVGIATTTPKSYTAMTVNGQLLTLNNLLINAGNTIKLNAYYNSATVTDKAVSAGFAGDYYLNNSTGSLLFRSSATSFAADADVTLVNRMEITSSGETKLTPSANTAMLSTTGAYSLTGSNAQSLIDLAGTWNTTGNPTAIKLNITNTASGATANLMDLQVGGTSEFKVTKAGYVGINQGTPTSMLHVEGSIALAITTKTTTYTLTSSDYTVVFDLNGNATANLPDATTCSGRIYVIKINATNVSDVLTIDPNGAQTIDGNATYGLQCQQAITIQSDGSNWRIIADYALGLNCL